MSQTINLGSVTAYASAVEGGYTGTYAEFCAATANVAEIGELQTDTMPTASADRVGEVLQYTGATSGGYTHGYFYECVDNSGTYSWQNVPVQVDQAGHTIVDSTGTDMTQRNKLKFTGGAAVTDDSTNNQTIVDVSSKVDETNISSVQTTLTATKNYAINDPFIYDGQLYKADSAISSGGTIVISGSGQNASVTTIEELMTLKNSGHTILNSSGTAMNQRSKLQFDGLNVSDDSGNDKTVVTAPTPDYVDEQYNNITTYSKGMTCISGNKRYRYINSTASSGHQPPNATYWEEYSVSNELGANKAYEVYRNGSTDSPYMHLITLEQKRASVIEGVVNYCLKTSSGIIGAYVPQHFRLNVGNHTQIGSDAQYYFYISGTLDSEPYYGYFVAYKNGTNIDLYLYCGNANWASIRATLYGGTPQFTKHSPSGTVISNSTDWINKGYVKSNITGVYAI